MTAFDDWEKIANRTGQLLQAAPPQTGVADDGVHKGNEPFGGEDVKRMRDLSACRPGERRDP
jgi:hypothetical protein